MIKLNRPECPNPAALTRGVYNDPTNKTSLRAASFGKCMYCEADVIANTPYDIEHIKPKSVFPELEFEWSNLGYACPKCNREYKKSHFDENLINPYDEDPKTHLQFFGSMSLPVGDSEKADITADIVGLNRPELLLKRTEKLASLRKTVRLYKGMEVGGQKDAIKEQLLEEALPDKEFSLLVKCYLKYEGIE